MVDAIKRASNMGHPGCGSSGFVGGLTDPANPKRWGVRPGRIPAPRSPAAGRGR
jgi:hypothetical protein